MYDVYTDTANTAGYCVMFVSGSEGVFGRKHGVRSSSPGLADLLVDAFSPSDSRSDESKVFFALNVVDRFVNFWISFSNSSESSEASCCFFFFLSLLVLADEFFSSDRFLDGAEVFLGSTLSKSELSLDSISARRADFFFASERNANRQVLTKK